MKFPVGRERLAALTARPWVVGAVLVVLLAAIAGGVVLVRDDDDLPDGVVLRTGDTTVTEQDLDERVRALRALYGIERPTGSKELSDFNREAARAAALSIILDRAAREQDIVITDKQTNAALKELIVTQYGADGEDEFYAVLGREGASEGDVKTELARQLRIDELYKAVTKGAADSVTDEELRAYYRSHKDKVVRPEQRRISNIVVVEKSKAVQIARRARAGQPFGGLARKYSLDESTRDGGGDLGLLTRDMLESSYAAAAFKTGTGRVFGPVQTSHGWNVGLVAEVQPRTRLSLAQAKESLRTVLVGQEAVKRWRSWLAERLREADVEYAPEFKPKDPLEPPGELPTPPWEEPAKDSAKQE